MRMTLTLVIIVVAVAEGILTHFGLGMDASTLTALIALVGTAVVGDSVRPSGMGKPSPEPSADADRADPPTQPK